MIILQVLVRFLCIKIEEWWVAFAHDLKIAWEVILICVGIGQILSMVSCLQYFIDAGFINRIWFWFQAFLTQGVIVIYILYILDDIQKNVTSDTNCKKSLYPGCYNLKLYCYYGCMGILGLLAILQLIQGFMFSSINQNFASAVYQGPPYKRCTTFLFPFVFSILIVFVMSISWGYFVLAMTQGINENVGVGVDFDNQNSESVYFPFVRKQVVPWYKFYGACFTQYMGFCFCAFLLAYQRAQFASIAAQWYFSRSKPWLRNIVKNGREVCSLHYGTYMNHAFWIMFFAPFRFMFSSCKVYVNRIKITTKCSKCLIMIIRPFVFFYDFIFKYKNSEAQYQTAIFGDDFSVSGEKLYYLQMRNWDRFKAFKGKFIFFSNFNNIFVSTVASFVCYFVFMNQKMLGNKSFLFGDEYEKSKFFCIKTQ